MAARKGARRARVERQQRRLPVLRRSLLALVRMTYGMAEELNRAEAAETRAPYGGRRNPESSGQKKGA